MSTATLKHQLPPSATVLSAPEMNSIHIRVSSQETTPSQAPASANTHPAAIPDTPVTVDTTPPEH